MTSDGTVVNVAVSTIHTDLHATGAGAQLASRAQRASFDEVPDELSAY